jgi:AraC family transcriptional regulator
MSDQKIANSPQPSSPAFGTLAVQFGSDLTHSSHKLGWSGLLVQKTKSLPQGITQFSLSHFMLATTATGQFNFRLRGSDRLSVRPSDVVIVEPQVRNHGEVTAPCSCSVVYLEDTMLSEVPQFKGFGQRKELNPALATKDAAISHFISMLAEQVISQGSYGKLYSESLGMALAAYVVQTYLTPTGESRKQQGLSRRQLDVIDEYISSQIATSVQLQDLADLCSMSRYHFLRQFKESTGIPPHRYLIEWRIAEARKLLCNRTLPIADIAIAVGFNSQSHFTQAFTRISGISPLVYRRETTE